MTRGFIPAEEEKYVLSLVDTANVREKKVGLQRLCGFLRAGFVVRDLHRLRQTLNGLLYSNDVKVRRWTLASIALCGGAENLHAVAEAISRFLDEPELVASSIATLFAIAKPDEVDRILKERRLPLEGAMLIASAQHHDDSKDRIAKERVQVSTASPLELRMATLLIGLNRAPEHMFELSHLNKEVIGVLNLHDDDMVAQYSVWAMCEVPEYDVEDLRFDLRNIEGQPGNVRDCIYRLIVNNEASARSGIDYVSLGSNDQSDEAREGLSAGLRKIFFDGIEEVTIRWLSEEISSNVKQSLIEHMAFSSDRCVLYEPIVMDAYVGAPVESTARARIRAAAQETAIYKKLRRIDLESDQLLLFGSSSFGGGTVVNQNISGTNVNIGVVSGSGEVKQIAIESIGRSEAGADLKEILRDILSLSGPEIDEEKQRKVAAEVKAVADEPSKSMVARLGQFLKGALDGVKATSTAGKSVLDLAQQLGALAESTL